MGITTAEYANPGQTVIKTTYDDGRPIAFVPDEPGNRDRAEIAEWEALPNTITPFVDVAGRVTEAKGIGIEKINEALRQSVAGPTINMGGFNFTMTRQLFALIVANIGSGASITLNLIDQSNVSQAIAIANQQTGFVSLRAFVEGKYAGLQTDVAAVNAATTVAQIDAALAASSFGDLSPVYG